MHLTTRLGIVLTTFILCGSPAAPGAVTLDSLLDEMTDLKRLAELPHPAYTTKQFSSYDRGAKSPSENWFANGDAGHYLRAEERDGRKEQVMMDAQGPGAIVRIWSANPDGTLRIYIDGADTPAIEAPMKDLLGGKVPHLPTPIAGVRAAGWNLYFPIPYAKSCKVTSDGGRFYYHVNYRTYAPGTEVKSFARGDLERLSGRIHQIGQALSTPLKTSAPPADAQRIALPRTIESGQKQSIDIKGPAAIAEIRLRIEAENVPVAARGVVLHIAFDGQETVETPLGDFFGTAPGLNPYRSLPLGVVLNGEGTFFARWLMPFEREARLTLRNLTGQPVTLHGTVATIPYEWTERSLHFHAGWRIQRDIPTRPFIDWTHLECTGTGRFVGGMLHLINPTKVWWGEGDEKIYVDGEDFPSHFGTGTEDYYGYAWGSSELYTHAYHAQSRCDGPGVYGHNSESRYHIIDDIPFTKSFKFDMENWHAKEDVKVTRAAVSFWYARPGGTDSFKPITAEDVKFIDVPPHPGRLPGIIEGEMLLRSVVQKTGDVSEQTLGGDYSSDKQLRWQAGKVGDRLVLAFESKKAGPQRIFGHFKKAHDYAIAQISINGQKAGDPIDFYSKETGPTGEIELGTFDLKAGRNELTLELTGVNPQATPKLLVGLDYIRPE